MTDYSCFNFELSFIEDPTIKRLVEDILKYKVPDYITTYHASSSGFYHPLNKNGEPETIIEHSKAVTRMMMLILLHPMIREKFNRHDMDIMIGSAILHDSVKYGVPPQVETTTVHKHPILVSLLYPYENKDEITYNLFGELVEVIMAHHGPWRTSKYDSYVLPEISNNRQYYLHMADYLASRKIIRMDLDDTNEIRGLLSW